jgi:anti-sigma B factor antagonist
MTQPQAPAHPDTSRQPSAMRLYTSTHRQWTVVHIHGQVDLTTYAQLRSQLIALISAGQRHLILDLKGVDFLDSTGLAVLVTARHRIRSHDGDLRLVATNERVLLPLRITGLLGAFCLHPDLTHALTGSDRERPG